MKRVLLLITIILSIFFIPNKVLAAGTDVELKSIEMISKTGDAEIVEEASIQAGLIKLNINMYKIDDSVTYKLVVKNTYSKDLIFDKNNLINENEYIAYEIGYEDDSRIIKPNQEKEITIKVYYKTEAPKELFRSAKYDASRLTSIDLSDQIINIANTLKNMSYVGIVLVMLIIVVSIIYIVKNRKATPLQLFGLLLLLFIVPKTASAAYQVTIPVNSKVSIIKVQPKACTFEGELVQGAEYVNGQYTYRYQQETYGDGSYWGNMSYDGWGVTLTDKTSEDDVTTPLCSTINDKPIVSMNYMFYGSKTHSIDLSSFVTSEVVKMPFMFYNVDNITELDLSTFDTSKVMYFERMFATTDNLESINLYHFDVSSAYSMYGLFEGAVNLKSAILDGWDLSNLESSAKLGSMFNGCSSLKDISLKEWKLPSDFSNFASNTYLGRPSGENIDVTGWDLSVATNLKNLFMNASMTKHITGLDTWDTSHITNMNAMFQSCSNLKEIIIENWDTSNVTNVSYFVAYLPKLEKLVLHNFDLSSVTGQLDEFSWNLGNEAPSVLIDIKDMDLSNVTSLYDYFIPYAGQRAGKIAINIDNLNLSSITDASYLIQYAGNNAQELEININNLDISSATTCTYLVNNAGATAKKSKLVMTNIKAGNLTNAERMFIDFGTSSLDHEDSETYLKLENWDLKSVQNVNYIFEEVGKRSKDTTIIMKNIDMTALTSAVGMYLDVAAYGKDVHIEFENITAPNIVNVSSMFYDLGRNAETVEYKGLNEIINEGTTNFYSTFYGYGYNTDASRDYGTIDIYGGNCSSMFYHNGNMRAVINLHGNVTSFSTEFGGAFSSAATTDDSEVIINYTSDVDIDTIMAGVADNPKIKKGVLLDN